MNKEHNPGQLCTASGDLEAWGWQGAWVPSMRIMITFDRKVEKLQLEMLFPFVGIRNIICWKLEGLGGLVLQVPDRGNQTIERTKTGQLPLVKNWNRCLLIKE